MKKKILVIDDERIIITSLSKLLEKNGYEVFVVRSGQDALGIIEEVPFDLIISDIQMPGTTGIKIIKNIRETLKRMKTELPPVIFITGYANNNSQNEAQSLNPVDYIYKPFDIAQLVSRVNECLSHPKDTKL